MSESRPRLLPLPGFTSDRMGTGLSVALIVAVAASRLLLLPEGPWEQDEALFAAGVLDFDVTRHRPHPPGFPGWVAWGKLLNPLLNDPVRALQLAASIASTMLFVLLAHVLVPWTRGGRATAASLAVTLSPLCWMHAPRAFSTTPAIGCAVLALWLWRGADRSWIAGWIAWGIAASVRPQLAPELLVLAILSWRTRPSLRAWRGPAAALVVLGIACGAVVASGSSADAVLASVGDHLDRHGSDRQTAITWSSLGFTRAMGHPFVAAVVVVLALGGVLRLARRDWRAATWLMVLIGVTTWMVLLGHHPGFPRYAVALLLALLPAVGLALDALPRRWGLGTWIAFAAAGGLEALGPLLAMQGAALPVMAAVDVVAQDPRATALAYAHGKFSFVRLAAERHGIVSTFDVLRLQDPPSLPAGAYTIAGRTLKSLDGVTTCTFELPPASQAAMRFSQGRFSTARLARDAVLLGAGVHEVELDEHRDRYAWLSGTSSLQLPQGSEQLVVHVDVPHEAAPQHVLAFNEHGVLDDRTLLAGPARLEFDTPGCQMGCAVTLQLPGARLEPGDTRELTVRLEGAWVRGSEFTPAYSQWSPGKPITQRVHDVVLDGFEAPEVFGKSRGAWTTAHASATFPALPGTLRIRLARPQHVAGQVTVRSDVESLTFDLGANATVIELPTHAPQGQATLHFDSPTFVPAHVREGSNDTRALGLIVFDVTLLPNDDACRPTLP